MLPISKDFHLLQRKTNKWQCQPLRLNNKKSEDINRLPPHFFISEG